MAENKPITKKKLMEFFDIYLEYEKTFKKNPRLRTALKAYVEKGSAFLEGKTKLADFELPEDHVYYH